MSDPVNPLYAVLCLAVAFGTMTLFTGKESDQVASHRFASIDGLRGYLAFLVFIHHGCTWYYFLRTGAFFIPSSSLYTHFGQSSVLLFFMITGLLFFSKLLDDAKRPIDWLRLYVSRILRLSPLYLLAMVPVGIIVAVESDYSLHESPSALLRDAVAWLSFQTIGPQNHDINQFDLTAEITSGVTWSLRYEWLFYFALPLLGLALGRVPAIRWILFSALIVLALLLLGDPFSKVDLFAFVGGVAAAVLTRRQSVQKFARTRWATVLTVIAVAVAVRWFPWAYDVRVEALLAVGFVLIAAGNTLLGALDLRVSRALGDISYGIYLLHGIVLYITFRFVVGFERARALSASQHWAIVCACGVAVLLVSKLAFRYVETPCMKLVSAWTARARRWVHVVRSPTTKAVQD